MRKSKETKVTKASFVENVSSKEVVT
jgi:hypothetical protein